MQEFLQPPLQEHAITSDEALALEDLPQHNNTVVCVGAGYISLEFAHIFHGFGCDTHVMYRKARPLRGCATKPFSLSHEVTCKEPGVSLSQGRTLMASHRV